MGQLLVSSRPGPRVRLALATFGILALELAVIRWLASQIRLMAYFNNLVLIAAFLGMGLGVALGRKRPELYRWLFPTLFLFSLIAGTAELTGLSGLVFPDPAVHLWGAEQATDVFTFASVFGLLLGLFWLVVAIFTFAGTAVGHYFGASDTLDSYSWDLLGSLLGVIAFALLTAAGTPPLAWFLLGCLPLLLLAPSPGRLAMVALVLVSVRYSEGDALFSPYNRIDLVETEDFLQLQVNRDFHQFVHDLSDERLAGETDPEVAAGLRIARDAYRIPYALGEARGSALIIGAGTGNDVQAALREGFQRVTSVDIDGTILRLGKELHPEAPYDQAGVTRVVNDGRAYLEQHQGPGFDVVSFGLVDSHSMFSAMSSLRLENYLYTEEGLRAAWDLVNDDGYLAVSFSVFGGQWISDRMYWTLAKATGITPLAVMHGMQIGTTFIVPKSGVMPTLDTPFPVTVSAADPGTVATTRDDWPFLYLRPGSVPWGYIFLLGGVLVTATIAVRQTFGGRVVGGGFHAPLFLMGAAFLLLETRGVTTLSLLYGSTWIVNAFVFSGILFTALMANLFVTRYRQVDPRIWFIPLLTSLAILWLVPTGALNEFGLVARGVIGGLLVGLPIGFAGVIVSSQLAAARDPAAALGSNLLGAVLGGCLEYASMALGLQALVGMAAVLYLASGLILSRERVAVLRTAPAAA